MYKIISPATSANIGAGFDCLGVCLSEANTFDFEEYEDAIIVNNHADSIRNQSNLAVRAFFQAAEIIGAKKFSGLKVDIKTVVPLSRGLGSSATCISAATAAAFMLSGVTPAKCDIFNVAAIIEGHPDNVAANIFGGLTMSYEKDGQLKFLQLDIHEKYKLVALIPDFKLSTQKAREALPEMYKREDVIFNMTRMALTVRALQLGDNELLHDSLDDRIHQPYRKELIKGYDDIVKLCENCGAIGTYLSGAGPTIMAVIDDDEVYKAINRQLRQDQLQWQADLFEINREGLEIYKTV